VIDELNDPDAGVDFTDITALLTDGKTGISEIDYSDLDDTLVRINHLYHTCVSVSNLPPPLYIYT
jgi:hypothetical protein